MILLFKKCKYIIKFDSILCIQNINIKMANTNHTSILNYIIETKNSIEEFVKSEFRYGKK